MHSQRAVVSSGEVEAFNLRVGMFCRQEGGYRWGRIGITISEEADFEVLNYLPVLNLTGSTKLHLSTEPLFAKLMLAVRLFWYIIYLSLMLFVKLTGNGSGLCDGGQPMCKLSILHEC